MTSSSRSYFMVNHNTSDVDGVEEPKDQGNDNGIEPIAIVGMACRLPGDVGSPSQLWDLLVNGRSGQCVVPKSRWNIDAFYNPNGDRPGSMNTAGGYFLKEDIRTFENSFFGINNLEASYMDPQQRKLLEVVYECFDNAGVRLEDISGSNTGAYVGNFTMDFLVMQARDPEYFHRYTATGMGTTILANRINHVFNLQGPSMVIDTACSSSLVSLHTAVTALRNRECNAAIVAGANLIQLPEQHMATMKAGVLSRTSTCHTFDATADGYGRADGIGALYVKRLSDAIRDGDPIRSVIRGTAVNTNGKTSGITLPSAAAQETVIRKAHEVAGLKLRDTAYIECHGTGTLVGDPIEVEALSKAFSDRPSGFPLLIGGIKSNLGHSEAASGIAGIIKGTLILENGIIPPTVGIRTVNPKIKTEEWNIEVVTTNVPFPSLSPASDSPRRVGVNSFGYGGSNAHAVLEAADSFLPPDYNKSPASAEILTLLNKTFLLPFSASNASSIERYVSQLGPDRLNIADLAYTLSTRKSKLPTRGFLLARQDHLKHDLRAEHLQIQASSPKNGASSSFAFVFTGQGAQWAEMGKGLIEQFPIVRASIQRMDAVLSKLPHPPPWTLLDILAESPLTSKINEVAQSQPACTALQIALVDLLAYWNVSPQGVIGHSSGEIAAAYAAKKLTAQQAIIIAYYRGYVVGKLPAKGQMMAVGLSPEAGQEAIKEAGLVGKLVVACVNSPVSITISGDSEACDILYSRLGPQGVFQRKLITGGRAYHSHHMAVVGEEYEKLVVNAIGKSEFSKSSKTGIYFASSVTGQLSDSALDAPYWRSNLENPVLFSQALQHLLQLQDFQIVELGPHAALKLPISQICKELKISDADLRYYSTLTRGQSSSVTALQLMGKLFLGGVDVSFQKINSISITDAPHNSKNIGVVVKDLPTYKWTYEQLLWTESRASLEFRHRKYPRHEILGSIIGGGNLTDHCWRNVLHVKDVPWLEDHKLDQTIVFPAAAFIGMATEAMLQIFGSHLNVDNFIELRQVNVITALTLATETTDPGVELFTTLRWQCQSGTTKSKNWWQFEIVSVKELKPVIHATGLICVRPVKEKLTSRVCITEDLMVPSAIRSWYTKLGKEGLNFGPEFQSIKALKVHSGKCRSEVIATGQLLLQSPGTGEKDARYCIHPITTDALIQAGIISTSGGAIENLRGQVPVMIESIIIRAMPNLDNTKSCSMRAKSEARGFGQTTLHSELYNHNGELCAQLTGIRMVAYEGAANDNIIERHPLLRVVWKPDIYTLLLSPQPVLSTALSYSQSNSQIKVEEVYNEASLKMLTILELATFKNPGLRILQLGGGEHTDLTRNCLDVLRSTTSFPRYQSFIVGKLESEGLYVARDTMYPSLSNSDDWQPLVGNDLFDLIIIPDLEKIHSTNNRAYSAILTIVGPGGLILSSLCKMDILEQYNNGFKVTKCLASEPDDYLVLAQKLEAIDEKIPCKPTSILIETTPNELGEAILKSLAPISDSVRRFQLDEISSSSITSGSTVILTIETNMELLADLDSTRMSILKHITNNATNIVWITGMGLMNCKNPNTALVNGLSRALMLEQPSSRFFVLDIDNESNVDTTAQNVVDMLSQVNNEQTCDFEFVQRRGILHISRFVPDEMLNEKFQQKQGKFVVEMPLRDVKESRLIIQKAGQFDTMYFKQEVEETALDNDFVEVEVKSVGLNAKDLYVLSGKIETRNGTCGLEFAGIIRAVGRSVHNMVVGDRVVVMAPHYYKTIERVPQWACVKMEASEQFSTMSTLCLAYASAIYGLYDRAQLRSGETVLIHSGAGGLGMAAIQVAKLAGARVFTTAGSPKKRKHLIENFALDPDHVFDSRDSSFLDCVMTATNGRGVDVILNSLTGDLLHDSWRACAEFGRFIEVGKRDILDNGSLDMRVFLKNATFTAFDLTALYHHPDKAKRDVWSRLLNDVLRMYRNGEISAFSPLKVFDTSQITDAFRYFSSRERIGKVSVSFDNPESLIKVLPYKHQTRFSGQKSFLLIGCLGGLGGAIAKWMVAQGARRLVFMGRSGTDRPVAKNLVADLRSLGADITVVKGDVVNFADVQKAVDSISGILGGVIQAAMGLDEALWTTMSAASWHTVIDPKLRGSWNIHRAIADREATERLDFFLMTSSVSGSVGTATEGNYCAANFFLDAFARYRKSLGLSATSLGLGMISEVGYLHENPEIEALLLRKGIQAINEDELIQIVDLALNNQALIIPGFYQDPQASSHFLTGLEPLGLKELRKRGFEGNHMTLRDSRASLLARALDDSAGTLQKRPSASAELTTALAKENSMHDALVSMICGRFSNLILASLAKIELHKPLAAYGMDSMLAAEFRTWIYHALKIDIPFLELLSETVTLGSLIDDVEKRMEIILPNSGNEGSSI